MHRGDQPPSSQVQVDLTPPKATGLEDPEVASPTTLQDVREVIRAHYRATAQLIESVYLGDVKGFGERR